MLQETAAVTNLVTKAQAVFDNLIVNPGNFDACVSRFIYYFGLLVYISLLDPPNYGRLIRIHLKMH